MGSELMALIIVTFLGPIRLNCASAHDPDVVTEFIGHIARPLTLTVRLFGNMTAKHIILMVLELFHMDNSYCNSGARVLVALGRLCFYTLSYTVSCWCR